MVCMDVMGQLRCPGRNLRFLPIVLLSKVKKDHALLHAYSRLTYQRLIYMDQSVQVQESLYHFHDCPVSS